MFFVFFRVVTSELVFFPLIYFKWSWWFALVTVLVVVFYAFFYLFIFYLSHEVNVQRTVKYTNCGDGTSGYDGIGNCIYISTGDGGM